MSLFIASGTNLGDRIQNLSVAKRLLGEKFELIAESRIYESPAVDYTSQPDFYNQVLELRTPPMAPMDVMRALLGMEQAMGRERLVLRGPRIIDLDMLFWDLEEINQPGLIVPHPRLFERSFVVLPLSELPGFHVLQQKFKFPPQFDNIASPLS